MDQGPLVSEQIEAGEKFVSLFNQVIPLQAAYWMKLSEDGWWNLYLASDQIDDTTVPQAYGEVHRIFGPSRDLWLDRFQVKVRSIDDPVSKDVIAIQKKHFPNHCGRIREQLLGGQFVEDAFVYAPPVAGAV